LSSAPTGCVCVDGRFSAPAEAVVSALDAGFLLGDGIFESLRAAHGTPYLLDRHLKRLYSAAKALEFTGMPAVPALAEQVHETVRRSALADAYVRVTVTRGVGGVGLAAPAGGPTVVVAALPAPARAPAERGIGVALLERRREQRAVAKSTSWQQAVLDRRRVERLGAEEGLYVTGDAHVLEGVSSNVFAVADGRLLTPAGSECFPGITRGRILELAPGAGLQVREAPLELEELMRAEEVFVTNAVQGLRRVRAIADTAVGGQPGREPCDALRRLYEEDRVAAATAVAIAATATATVVGEPR
jgi:branched-subunit amino acid aminotransferase/4-amino-4-deoxychorismate lyase